MVCHIDKETGGLVILIPKCIRCKRALKKDTMRHTNNDSITMTTAPIIMKEVLFICPKAHVRFQVGRLDLLEMAKYPVDKIIFESSDIDPSQFPQMRA